jgi:hypoxanthine phosphoribosyltransferase
LIREPRVVYSRARLATRVSAMGRSISRDSKGRPLDAVILLESAFVFAADLVRSIQGQVACHFVRTELRDVDLGGFSRREVFFSQTPDLRGRDILVVAGVLHTGVTLDFLCKRLMEGRPRSLRIAVLVDKPGDRHVDLQPDYFGFLDASNQLVGYGLAGRQGSYRNLPFVGTLENQASMRSGRGASRRNSGAGRSRRGKS